MRSIARLARIVRQVPGPARDTGVGKGGARRASSGRAHRNMAPSMRQIRSSPQQHGTQPDVETAKAPAARQTRQTTAWAAAGWGEGDAWAAALEGALAQIAPPRQSGRR